MSREARVILATAAIMILVLILGASFAWALIVGAGVALGIAGVQHRRAITQRRRQQIK